jgi:zinc transport system substrate-binding protein
MPPWKWLVLAAASVLSPFALSAEEPKLPVAVSLPPYQWLVERIGGDLVSAVSLLEEGEDPHSFQPPPRRVTSLSGAKVWFTVSMPFEEALIEKLKQTSPNLRIVSVHEGIELVEGEDHDHDHDHAHGDAKKEAHAEEEKEHHEAGESDPHVWLSPILLKQQAHTVAHTLGDLDPAHADEYEANAVTLEKELDALHASLTETLAPLKGTTLFVFHPAFGYFARTYGMKQESIETKGREPSAKHLTELINEAKEDGVKLILVQPQFSQASAEKMAKAIGATVHPVNDLGKDVLATLRALGEAVKASR